MSSQAVAHPTASLPSIPLTLVTSDGSKIEIEIRRPDGYVNASMLCQEMGKEWKNYYAVARNKEFLKELSKVEKIPVENLPAGKPASTFPPHNLAAGILASTNSAGNSRGEGPGLERCLVESGKNRFQHTWVHPDVAIHLAQWADSRFGVAVSRLVRRYQTGQVTTEESVVASKTLASQVRVVDDPVIPQKPIINIRRRTRSRDTKRVNGHFFFRG